MADLKADQWVPPMVVLTAELWVVMTAVLKGSWRVDHLVEMWGLLMADAMVHCSVEKLVQQMVALMVDQMVDRKVVLKVGQSVH